MIYLCYFLSNIGFTYGLNNLYSGVIALESYSGTGYAWHKTLSDKNIQLNFKKNIINNSRFGSSKQSIWDINIFIPENNSNTYKFKFEKSRPWEQKTVQKISFQCQLFNGKIPYVACLGNNQFNNSISK